MSRHSPPVVPTEPEPMRLPPLDPDDGPWPYQQIAAALQRAIGNGDFPYGRRLLASEVARHYKTTNTTAKKALKEVQLAGMVAPREGRQGLFVCSPSAARVNREPIDELMRLPPLDQTAASWRYQQIAAALLRAIHNGDLAPGQRVLASQLADHYGVTRKTAEHAVKELRLAGAVMVRPGRRGVFVAAPPAADGVPEPPEPPERCLTVGTVAELLGVTRPTVYALVKKGDLAFPDPNRSPGSRGVTVASLAAYLDAPGRHQHHSLSVATAAALLNLSQPRTSQLVYDGRLVARPVGGITVESLAALLADQRQEVVDTFAALGFDTSGISTANGVTYGLLKHLLRRVRRQAERRLGLVRRVVDEPR